MNFYALGAAHAEEAFFKTGGLKDMALDAWEHVDPAKTPMALKGTAALATGLPAAYAGGYKGLEYGLDHGLNSALGGISRALEPQPGYHGVTGSPMVDAVGAAPARVMLGAGGGLLGGGLLAGGAAGAAGYHGADQAFKALVRNRRGAFLSKAAPKVALGGGAALIAAGLARHLLSRDE